MWPLWSTIINYRLMNSPPNFGARTWPISLPLPVSFSLNPNPCPSPEKSTILNVVGIIAFAFLKIQILGGAYLNIPRQLFHCVLSSFACFWAWWKCDMCVICRALFLLIPRFTLVLHAVCSSLLFTAITYSVEWVNHSSFLHSLIGELGIIFQVLLLWTLMAVSLNTCAGVSLYLTSRSGIDGAQRIQGFNLTR